MFRVVPQRTLFGTRKVQCPHEVELPGGSKARQCVFSPHSPRATAATLLLDSDVAIEAVRDLLDHEHITTTQIVR
jgi:site-specific recombinase XerC